MNNIKNNKIPKCVSQDCECDAAINKHYPDSEGGQYWTLCEECYNADQQEDGVEKKKDRKNSTSREEVENLINNINLPEECNCTPREMLGTSWWKQLGFGRPCVCAELTRDTLINKIWDTIKKEINPEIPRRLAEHGFNISTHHVALVNNRERRPWRRPEDVKELAEAIVKCADEFGMDLTKIILPKGIKVSAADENGFEVNM